jgi:hypothetical protein
MLPYALLTIIVNAQTNPPDAVIEDAVLVDIPPHGFDSIVEFIPALIPLEIPVDDLSGEEGLGWGCFVDVWYSISNLNIGLNLDSASIVPQEDYLELNIGLGVEINNSDDPFLLDYELTCIEYNCQGYVNPFPVDVGAKIRLELNDLDGDGINELDAIVEDLQYNYALQGEDINIDSCALGTFEDVLNIFGLSIFDLVLSFAAPALESAVNDLVPELETTIEEAFSELNIQQTLEVEGAEFNLSVSPQDVIIKPEGMRLQLGGSFTSPTISDCIADLDQEGSLSTSAPEMPIGYSPQSISNFHLGATISDDFVNQALYSIWRGGVLCYTVDDDLFALDTSILNLLTDDAFLSLIPETQEMVIKTLPNLPPTLNMTTNADLAVDLNELGLNFYTVVDQRRVRVLNVALSTDVGIYLPLDANSGNISVDIDLDTDRFISDVQYNEFAEEETANIESSFSSQLDTILGLIDIEGMLGDMNFTLPSVEGLGLLSLNSAPSGSNSEDLGIFAELGSVPYSGGCDSSGEDSGCGGGCSNAGTQNRWFLGGFAIIFGFLRRRE